MRDQRHCANCGRPIDGGDQKFCPACGQPTPAHRIDWHFLGHELEHSVLHMDRGLFFTLKHLVVRPGHFIRDYLDGQRARHVKPWSLLLMMAAILVLLGHFLLGGDVTGSSFTEGMREGMRDHPGNSKIDPALLTKTFEFMQDWVNRHIALVTLVLLPLEAAAFKLAFRRFRHINYPEWLVITSFLTAQTYLIWILFVPLQRGWSSVQALMIFPSIAYGLYTLAQFFRDYPRWKAVLRGLLGFGLFQIMTFVVMFGTTLVVFYLVITGQMQLSD